MKSTRILGMAAAVLALTVGSTSAQYKPLKGDPKEINFGIISTESTSNLREAWEPFLKDMEKALRMKVKPFFASDYAGIIEGMRFGKVHVAWFGNKSAMEAVDRAGAEVFVQEIKADGTQGYYSHILTHVDNKDINSLKDLFARCNKTLSFGIGDPNSTSGFLVPSYYVFAQNDVDPKACFKKIKIIWTSPLIPADPITYRKDLSKQLKAKIKGFFLSYGRLGENVAHEMKVLNNLGSGGGGYTDSNNSQLYPIRQLALFKNKLSLEADTRMDPAEKAKRMKEINDKLADLKILTRSM
jgi:phosphonate transport system substrate-binding protein